MNIRIPPVVDLNGRKYLAVDALCEWLIQSSAAQILGGGKVLAEGIKAMVGRGWDKW